MKFLHEHPDFKSLIDITAEAEKINEPGLVEKDYWLMHVLWALQDLKFDFHLKGGTSLSKGFHCIHRFSEDIDIKIEPPQRCGLTVYREKNHDKDKHRDSRKNFFDWLAVDLDGKIPGIVSIKRDHDFDDAKFRSGGIRLAYDSHFAAVQGLKEGVLLEIGFDRTAPNQPRDISSWAYEAAKQNAAVTMTDNRAMQVACYEPKYTFVEKLQAVVRKFRLYKEGKTGANLPINFIRHYYDIFQLIDLPDVQSFIGTGEYESFKRERFGGDDPVVKNSAAFSLSSTEDRRVFEAAYNRSASLYYRARPSFEDILDRLGMDLHRL